MIYFDRLLGQLKTVLNYHNERKLNKYEKLEKHIMNNIYALKINSYLEQFNGIYSNKNICIVGSGPSVNKYKSLDDIDVFIGINKAFEDTRFCFNYLFANDQFVEGMDGFINYNVESCKKFVGYFNREVKFRMRNDSIRRANAYRFVLDSKVMGEIPYDISISPFADLKGTVFCALQFALYTCPKKIYLVGFDCDHNGNSFYNNKHDYYYQFESWKKIKKFIDTYYNNIELISVNPVGLKGIFTDLYT